MIRRQVYLAKTHQAKLADVAARWGCSESEVLRRAIDGLLVSDDPIEARLVAVGLLAPTRPEVGSSLTAQAAEELERQLDRWSEARSAPLGLADAVVEDRR
jgi:hypothetical protein